MKSYYYYESDFALKAHKFSLSVVRKIYFLSECNVEVKKKS